MLIFQLQTVPIGSNRGIITLMKLCVKIFLKWGNDTMGNLSWGKGRRAGLEEGITKGLEEGITKGLVMAFTFALAVEAISAVGDYIATRKTKAEQIARKRK